MRFRYSYVYNKISIDTDLCKNDSRHSNVFINTFNASGPLDLLTYDRISI